jgi:hypothetical protein
MKRQRLNLLVAVGAALLLVLAVGAATAFAQGGILGASADTTVSSIDTTAVTDTTTTTSTTLPSATDPTTSTSSTSLPPTTDTTVLGTPPSSTTTTNWGQYISGLRHAGDHTPAAVLKGKKVPGWYKHHPTTTATTGTTP